MTCHPAGTVYQSRMGNVGSPNGSKAEVTYLPGVNVGSPGPGPFGGKSVRTHRPASASSRAAQASPPIAVRVSTVSAPSSNQR